ncbi:endonuclease/exonuclease/phosphatase family protein [Amnibacterium flavum]|uniref:Hydrolase n=1 Tax=Amnibacterium flavum TaxID=2173173 RepID=A0A2V1HPR9_9MICO|nr:endonuclease/exonuclease/phosphatase family protein [Amnibacterium flavum]PVZ94321.1 hydrolase [Amnibacterium flavum]
MPTSESPDARRRGIRVMSFNLRRQHVPTLRPRLESWSRRAPLVQQLVAEAAPSVLGVQEALPDQDDAVLEGLGSTYRRIGNGRNADGSDERCTIYFDSSRLELLHWHQTALSDHPNVPGSRSWGNVFPRIATVATFADQTNGGQLSVVNTHLDPFSPRSRLASAHRLREVALSLGPSVVVMGDLNARGGSAAVRALLDGGALRDSWSAADRRTSPAYRTLSNYGRPRLGARIDWIFVGSALRVREAAVLGRRFEGKAASDHEPVIAVLEPTTGSADIP